MQINSNDLQFLVGDYDSLCKAPCLPSLIMFSDLAVNFLAELSNEILKDKRSRGKDDIISYAFWIRRTSLVNEKKKYTDRDNRVGRGLAFHIAPSNVPVNFAVSLTSSLLAGNSSIIRVSNKLFEQIDIICDAINRLLNEKYSELRGYIIIIRYDYNEHISQALSEICDVRVVWGGDRTINEIRNCSLPVRAIEMTFSDRHSIAIINSDKYLTEDRVETARKFYTDTYYTDQNACSSPRIVIWVGDSIENARLSFWEELSILVSQKYDLKTIQAIDKYTSVCSMGMGLKSGRLVSNDNYIVRVEIDTLDNDIMNYKNSCGLFFEYKMNQLEEIKPLLDKKCQTVSVLGIDKGELKEKIMRMGVRGVDRIVDMGKTMDLSFIWDGYKMIETMSRYVYVGD